MGMIIVDSNKYVFFSQITMIIVELYTNDVINKCVHHGESNYKSQTIVVILVRLISKRNGMIWNASC
jgi:hypothetical protein